MSFSTLGLSGKTTAKGNQKNGKSGGVGGDIVLLIVNGNALIAQVKLLWMKFLPYHLGIIFKKSAGRLFLPLFNLFFYDLKKCGLVVWPGEKSGDR